MQPVFPVLSVSRRTQVTAMYGLFFLALALVVSLGASKCPDGSVTSAIDSKLCYTFMSNATTWMEGKLQCNSMNGHLVTINDGFTNVYLTGMSSLATSTA